VTFSSDDEVVVALSCSSFSPSDPSNKLFIALCYNLKVIYKQLLVYLSNYLFILLFIYLFVYLLIYLFY